MSPDVSATTVLRKKPQIAFRKTVNTIITRNVRSRDGTAAYGRGREGVLLATLARPSRPPAAIAAKGE